MEMEPRPGCVGGVGPGLRQFRVNSGTLDANGYRGDGGAGPDGDDGADFPWQVAVWRRSPQGRSLSDIQQPLP